MWNLTLVVESSINVLPVCPNDELFSNLDFCGNYLAKLLLRSISPSILKQSVISSLDYS